jgi:hypothetical protein
MIQKEITFFGHPRVLACDANCEKAWGINMRPRVLCPPVSPRVYQQEDDYALLADGELGIAPQDTGTWEGEHTKPVAPQDRLNKWCARECERSVIVKIGENIFLPDFSKRRYNMPSKHRGE